MIVPDASAVALLFDDPDTDIRVDVATRILAEDAEWVVPEIWRTEVLSVFRGLFLAGKLTTEDAKLALHWLEEITVITAPTGPHLRRMWDLRSNLTTYDANYVAVAESHDLTLVTADVRIARAGVARCPIRVIN